MRKIIFIALFAIPIFAAAQNKNQPVTNPEITVTNNGKARHPLADSTAIYEKREAEYREAYEILGRAAKLILQSDAPSRDAIRTVEEFNRLLDALREKTGPKTGVKK